MLDATLRTQLQQYLVLLRQPIRLVASLDGTPASAALLELLKTLAELSERVSVATDGHDARRPSFTIERPDGRQDLRFAGLPLGHEFSSLVLALLWSGGHPPKVDAARIAQIQAIHRDLDFEVYMSQSCHNCPDVVQALSLMAIVNPRIRTRVIEGGAFPEEVECRGIMAVPSVVLNGETFASGRMTLEEVLMKLDDRSVERERAALAARAPYGTLVVGGGPAGAAAAIYAARKGLRVGLVAERFGGQVNDTLTIENYIAVPETEGPKFVSALQAHARAYEIDLIEGQRAASLDPAVQPGGLIALALQSGASLRSRSVIIATGARWRNVNVPGEEQYRNKGVAYCPHCDGPLFRGKRVAVIGGGNSGVEAAIDLAGLASEVTLVEFADRLKADAVLVTRLHSLTNVRVVTHAQTTEITGRDGKVDGLRYRDRASGDERRLALEGVFVQIGLVPNTDWLRGTVELSPSGEIVIDSSGQTSLPGVFGAGDCTTVPFKQIVVAAGEGAKSALGAFEYLIRTPESLLKAA